MIESLLSVVGQRGVDALAFLLAFALTALMDSVFHDKLPHDHGREFAVNGALSKGKARGSGLIFVLCIALVSLAFLPFKVEYVIYTILLIASMLSGYFDDAAETIGVATASFGLTCTRIIPTKFLVGSVSRIITTPVPYLPFWFGKIVLPFLIVNKVSSNEEISISLAFEYEELLSVIRLNPKICSPISFDVSITSCSSSAIASPTCTA